MTQHMLPPRDAPRAVSRWLAVALAALVCAPVAATPRHVAAAVLPPLPIEIPAAPDEPAPKDDSATPSIHYEQALEHQGDRLDFEPGDRVTVPFTPRKGDDWKVDGKAPRTLPAGHATGQEMRATPREGIWAAGPPADVSGPAASETDSGLAPASYVSSGVTSGTEEVVAGAPIGANGLRREVFGFLPYWEVSDSTTVLDWKTLSTIAYFSVGCTSSGGLDKTDSDGSLSTGWGGWTSSKMTSIINAAHQNQTRVVLTVSCFAWSSTGASRQASLLGSSTARANLAKVAAAAVRDRGADGINLDFEPIVSGYSEEFTALVRSVRSELNKIAPGYQLTFDTMGSIGNQPIVEATAPGGADAVFVMGYDYRTAGSSTAGSISPLTGPRYDLNDTINAYTAKISPSKVILGIPYYGRAWSTSSDNLNASTLSLSKYGSSSAPTYGEAMDLVAQYGRRWDSVEQTPWTAYRKQTCTGAYGCVTSWRELYYDDAASLRLRYDLVNRTSLRGAGIWALGYDGTRPELRQALSDKFLADKSAPIVGIGTLAQQQRDEGFRVGWSSWDDSSIAGYDVQVATDGGAWAAWLTSTTLTSSIFLGSDGPTYAFRVRATDVHGNASAWYAAASATTIDVPGGIEVGGFASVLVDGLRMRASPATGASIMTTLAAGDSLRVIGGPVAGEGYTWWQVSGPVKQWAQVDAMQVGGWVAASGNGATNAGPRRPVYATRVAAGITDMKLNPGGKRYVTPNGDGDHDTLHLTWTNHRTFDSLALRVFRLDGSLVGTVSLGGTGNGSHAWDWDGRVGGVEVPAGAYVLQLQGVDGGTTYSAPSASPVSPSQIPRTGVMVGEAAPTAVLAFERPASPTKATTLTWKLKFGGSIAWLSATDFTRTGTATGCVIGTPVGDGTNFTITLTSCSAGTVVLGLKAGSVSDPVKNWGPATPVNSASLLIDRTAPVAATPRVTLRSGVNLASASKTSGLLAYLNVSAMDAGGAAVGSFQVKRSVDGGAYGSVTTNLTAATLAITLAPGHSYRFQVRARDKAGNISPWVTGPTVRPYLSQQTTSYLSWKGIWGTAYRDEYSSGSVRYATAVGASATYSFTGRAIAWVTTMAANRGAAKVYLDGVLVATVDTYGAATSVRRIMFAKTWSSSGFHTLRIVIVGTLGRERVDIDALEVLR
ncbi:MAG: glycosyl hydrolase family 18 protein [Candidatus Limnocylindrales bacterium]